MKRILTLLVLISLTSCYTNRQAEKGVNKAIKKKPEIAADILRKSFPCIQTKDTIVKIDTGYDFIEIQCPDQVPMEAKIDTIIINKQTKEKVYLPGKIIKVGAQKETVYINKYIKDSAEIYLAQKDVKDCHDLTTKLYNKLDKRNNWIISLLIALIISLLLNFMQWKIRQPQKGA